MPRSKSGGFYPDKNPRVSIRKSDYSKLVDAIGALTEAVGLMATGKTALVNVQELRENYVALRNVYFASEVEFGK